MWLHCSACACRCCLNVLTQARSVNGAAYNLAKPVTAITANARRGVMVLFAELSCSRGGVIKVDDVANGTARSLL